jgi:pilus assembly protein CpaF
MQIDFGPLTSLMNDAETTEIMVNSWDSIFIERAGQIASCPLRFVDARALEELVQALLFGTGRDVSKSLYFDGSLPNGSRYNVTLAPMSPKGPTMTIRKHSNAVSTLETLVRRRALSPKVAQFLSLCVRGRVNMIVCGGTGTGKTTFLNALCSLINPSERIVTIEDTAELQIRHANLIRLESVKDGPLKISIRECVANALRMRPDRIIVGECRGPETADMLQAMNTGHDGSLTTVHANSPVDCLARVESLVLSAHGDLPLKAVRRNISQAIDLVIQLKRDRTGLRSVSEITEIVGMEGEIITKATLFSSPEGKSGPEDFKSTGLVPNFIKKMEERDVRFPAKFFDPAFQGQF